MNAKDVILARRMGGGGSVPKPLTYDYMPEGYPKKTVQTTVLMEEQEVYFDEKSGVYAAKSPTQFELLEGYTYTVVWDGTEYDCVCLRLAGGPLYIGNAGILGLEQTNEPFLYGLNLTGSMSYEWVSADSSLSHTIKVIGDIEKYSTMDSAYIHTFNANDKYVSGLPTPAQILDQDGIDAIVGKTTFGEIKNNTAVFSYVYYDGTNLLKLRPFGTTQEDGTQIWQYAGVDVQSMRVCTLEFCFNGSADDSILTNVNILYPSAMYIKSSTAGSTKNFKITVDDSGTISATEVT